MFFAGMRSLRFTRRQRCKPQRHSSPHTALASCCRFGHSLAARLASSKSSSAFAAFFIEPNANKQWLRQQSGQLFVVLVGRARNELSSLLVTQRLNCVLP